MEAVPLFIVTLGLTGGLAYLLTQGVRQEIMSKWDQRRCDLGVMVMARMYKPADDPRSPDEFANDNFDFCSRSMVSSIFKIILAPVILLIGKEINMMGVIDQSMNGIRNLMANMMSTFAKIMDPFYRRFLLIGRHFANTFRRFMSAMERIFGIAVASIFFGISSTRATLNAIDFVIKVVKIILGILIGIFILLFFVLFPFTPVILSTLAVLSAVGIGVAGSGVFCFDPQTEVCMNDGTTKYIYQLNVGDKLVGDDYVEGILLTQREPNTTLYDYKGTIVSGSHVVWEDGVWKSVDSSRYGIPIHVPIQRLYSLRTGSRTITTCSSKTKETVLFRDWEEIPPNDSITDKEWDELIQTMLSNEEISEETSTEHPCFSATCLVQRRASMVPICKIQVGDVVKDANGKFTRVLGVYRGLVHIGKGNIFHKWFTDGVWWHQGDWKHLPVDQEEKVPYTGLHLITESGTFWIQSEKHSGLVRDFTEVGHTRLPETTEFLLRRLNEKPKA